MLLGYKLILCVITTTSVAAAWGEQDRADVCPRQPAEFAAVQSRVATNDPVAQTALASCYDLGLHVRPDGKQSIHWLTEAASQGYAPAQYELGRIYLYGRGVPADYAKALHVRSAIWPSCTSGVSASRPIPHELRSGIEKLLLRARRMRNCNWRGHS